MPRFATVMEPGNDNPPIRAPWMSEKEYVQLRPVKTYMMSVRAQSKAVSLPEGLTAEQLQALPQDEALRRIAATQDQAAVQAALILAMVESWTDRDGNPVPVTPETVEALDERDGTWLVEEIEKRGESIATQPAAQPSKEAVPPVSADEFPVTGDAPPEGRVPTSGELADATGAV